MILLITYGLESHNQKLLPWVYILKISDHLNSLGYDCRILNLKSQYCDADHKIYNDTNFDYSVVYSHVFYPVDWRFKQLSKRIISKYQIAYFPGSKVLVSDYLRCAFRMEFRKSLQYGVNILSRWYNTILKRNVLHDASYVLFFSEYTASYFRKHFRLHRVHVLPPFCDISGLERLLEPHATREKHFIYLGAPLFERGFTDLLMLRGALQNSKSTVKIKFFLRIDDHIDKHKVYNLLKKYECNNFQFILENLSRQELLHQISISQGVILPFNIIPCEIPLAAYEAYALGNLVVSTGKTSLSDVNRELGVSVENRSPRSLLAALDYLDVNPKIAEKLRNKSLLYVGNYNGWDAFLNAFTDLIKTLK